MRNPSQALLLAVLMASLILPPGLPLAGAAKIDPAAKAAARRILLVGDSLSIGLGKQLDAVFAGRPGVSFAHLGKVSSGLANPAFFDWEANLTAQVKAHHPDLVLIMLGANDNKSITAEDGRTFHFGAKEWDAAYAARLGRLQAIVRADNPGAAVYFIGVPVMADPSFNAEVAHINAVLAATAKSLPGCAYVDTRDVLADAAGSFAPMAKAPDGNLVKLRADDGVHISGSGSRLLAARCLEAVCDPAGLPKKDLLASLEDRELKPVAAGSASVMVAATPNRPAETPAAKSAPAKPAAPVVPVAAAPAPKPAPAAASAPGVYQVADGDTFWSVAKRLGVDPVQLAEANPGVDSRHMSIGQSLNVPAAASPAAPARKSDVAQAQAQAPAPTPAPAAAKSGQVHAVADGDNFWSVARRYNVTVAALTEANPGVDPTKLRIGQPLAIPGPGVAPVAANTAASGQSYTVADGDNFWSIARRLGLDVTDLKRVNAAVDPLKLQPGQVLALPGTARAARDGQAAPDLTQAPAAPQAAAETLSAVDPGLYPVAKGDTLWALSRRFGVSLDTLLSVNTEVDPARLQVGQLVTIPAAGQPTASAETLSFPVSAGDTLWGIARRFDIDIKALAAANPDVDPLRLRQGQTLRVPSSLAAVAAASRISAPNPAPAQAADQAPAAAADPQAYAVAVGDTLWNLARRFGVSVEMILAENAGLDPVRLQVGQIVRLPGNTVSMAAR